MSHMEVQAALMTLGSNLIYSHVIHMCVIMFFKHM